MTGTCYATRGAKQRLFCTAATLAWLVWAIPANAQTAAAPAQANGTRADQSPQSTEDGEIVVTAQKQEQRLSDVPVPMTVLSTAALLESNQVSIRDYFSQVPGFNLGTGRRGETFIAIRGLSTGQYNTPIVGIVIDDAPFGASTTIAGGFAAPDIDPSDLRSIEVLRGPQGTLYGAGAMGGLVKYVTVDPSTSEVQGRVQAGISGVRNGDAVGYDLRGALSLPLGGQAGIRVSGYSLMEPGYIDNVQSGEEAVNRRRAAGGRASFIWRPSSDWSVKLGAIYQDARLLGSPNSYVLPGLGTLEQIGYPNSQFFRQRTQFYNANIAGRIGPLNVNSVTAYSNFHTLGTEDQGAARNSPLILRDDHTTRKFSQELRVGSSIGGGFDWLLGGFYTNEDSPRLIEYKSINPTTGAITGTTLSFSTPSEYREYAVFGNVTAHFTDRFEIQVGARQSWNDQVFSSVVSSLPAPGPRITGSAHSFTYLIVPKFKFSEHGMLYGRIASGYRAGGPNVILTTSQIGAIPAIFGPDTTQNFELGTRGSLWNGVLSYDLSAYYIKWRDIQVTGVFTGPTGLRSSFTINGGRAHSQGFEASLGLHPWAGTTIASWLAINDPILDEGFPAGATLVGTRGDRLPYAPHTSARISARQDFSLSSDVEAFASLAVTYTGQRQSEFASGTTTARVTLPSYTTLDFTAGFSHGDWRLNVYATNLTDSRGLISDGQRAAGAPIRTYIRPRAIGLSIGREF